MKNIKIDDSILNVLKKVGNIQNFKSGEFIFKEDDTAENVYILIKGILEVLKMDESGSLNIINTISDINIFGEMAVFLEDKRSASVRAKTDVEVMAFPKNAFLQAASKIPKFNFSVMSSLIDRLNDINKKYVNVMEYKFVSSISFYILDNFINKNTDFASLDILKLSESTGLIQPEVLKTLFILEKNEAIYNFDTDNLPKVTFKIDKNKLFVFLRNFLYKNI